MTTCIGREKAGQLVQHDSTDTAGEYATLSPICALNVSYVRLHQCRVMSAYAW